ncbi:helix-turn-helix transcriptional regulator [Rhodoferax aquaticus]|uniref:Transcriptional regulator n=1 Tax=Rhodoferax aquaticus TaxID=2527691 RepID=A0A515EM12_9BURK|nr:metalloregulator ArsR/SmtB family transcription factor [Rhodoferax aquaticus]QDL53702.1 transcriptional regulator [Rhodoferax aquaticus]
MNTAEHILFLIKTRGPATAQQLALALNLTSMGARRHLETWQDKGLLQAEDRADKVGRPARYWMLTDAGHARFPDRHSDLTLQLIAQVRSLFGEAGLDQLISAREKASEASYAQRMQGTSTLAERVEALAQVREEEGYMAHAEVLPDGGFLLVENHCPICAAAKECQGFCRSELAVFRTALGPQAQVERVDHVLAGGQRCAYAITPIKPIKG